MGTPRCQDRPGFHEIMGKMCLLIMGIVIPTIKKKCDLGNGLFLLNTQLKTIMYVKLLTEGLPGIHQRFIPKKRFVCSRESTKRFLRFFPGNDAKRTLVSKLHIYHHCSENLMRF